MTTRDRIKRTLNFEPVDRLPVIEWAHWWGETIDRWRGEGLPDGLDREALFAYLGLDLHHQYWITPIAPDYPPSKGHGIGNVESREDYLELKRFLYPDPAFDAEAVRGWARKQAAGETAVWISLEGPFWFPRTLFGIEPHLYAFYDQPELMREINEDLLAYNLRVFEQFCDICVPDFMTFAEDMSYNHGPMLSAGQFEEFISPFYHRICPVIRERGTVIFVDTDGDVTVPVQWYEGVGVEGFLPLERMAGVDINAIRESHPRLRMVGAFDKTIMHLGEERMRQEFERILPVMRQGGYIPSCDHQTPPGVSLEDYRLYVRLLAEYAQAAVI